MDDEPRPSSGYSWAPLQPGHEVTLQHGAYSERKLAPLAVEIEQQARTSPAWPAYLRDPAYGPAVAGWARAEAVVELLWRYLTERDLDEALSETSREESEETAGRGQPRRRLTTAKRTSSAMQLLLKAEAAAARARSQIGLDPMSRAKLGKDIAVTAVQAGLAQLQHDGAELVAKARAAGALTEGEETS